MSEETASIGTVEDQISALFAEEEEQEEVNDLEEDDTPPEESNDDESEKEEESEEEVSWSKILNVDDDKIAIDDDGNLIGVNVKIDGKVETVALPELIAGYQTTKSYTQKSQALASERKEFETVRETVAKDYVQKIEDAQALNAYMQKSLLKEYQGVDWQSLRQQNPAEYAATIQDYQLRMGEIQKVGEAIKQERAIEQQRIEAETNKKTNEFLSGQVEILLSKNPEWQDQSKFKAAMDEYGSFMEAEYGIPRSQFDSIGMAGAIEAVKDLMKYKKGLNVADKKIMKAVPKFQKVTGKTQKTVSKAEKLAIAAKKATGFSKRDIQVSAIQELFNG